MSYFQPSYGSWILDTRRILRLLACVVITGAVAFSLARTIGKSPDDYQVHDFGAYYRAGNAVARDETPYVIDEHGPTASFVYAPGFAYFLTPLSYLDYTWASRLWMLCNWVLFLTCLLLASRLMKSEEGNHWPLLWLAILPLAGYFWINISSGQVGALMTALCLGWAVCQRRGRSFVGGILLSFAAALKLAPALLVPYLIIRRDWRGMAGFLAGGLFLLLVPAPWVGLDGAIRLHLEWARHCQITQIADQTCRIENQSFLGQLAHLPGIDVSRLQQAYPVIVLILAAACYWWIYRDRRTAHPAGIDSAPNQDELENVHLALLFILMTLAHPRAWTCNFVALTLGCFLLADRVCRRQPGWKVALTAIGLVILVRISPKNAGGDFSWVGWFHQGKDFWAAIIVAGACLWCHTRSRAAALPRYSSARMA